MKKAIYIFIYFITFAACEERFELDTSDFSPSIVVNSIFAPDNQWVVVLSTSRNALDPDSQTQFIDDADVKILFSSGQIACELVYHGNGVYTSADCFPEEEKGYILTVRSEKYGIIRSESRIPKKAVVKDVTTSENEEDTTVRFQMEDESQGFNYFIWNLINTVPKVAADPDQPDISTFDASNWVEYIKAQIEKVKTNRFRGKFSASENEFTNSTFETEFATKDEIKTGGVIFDPDTGVVDTLQSNNNSEVTMLQFMTVSEELYLYFKSIEDYLKYEGSNTSAIEPTTVYSNIVGGQGIFAGYAVQYVPVR